MDKVTDKDSFFKEALRVAGEDARTAHFYPHQVDRPTMDAVVAHADLLRREAARCLKKEK